MEYRILHEIGELEQAVETGLAVWGMVPLEMVPTNIMRAIVRGGGVIIGAVDGEQMVGMCLTLPLRRDGEWILWSHMAGVIPNYQGRGIGFGLKQAQRTWALENGFTIMAWTYDPLQRGNANFNLRRLGALVNTYFVNYYGEMNDAINRGLDSDRVDAIWQLADKRVVALADGAPPPVLVDAYPKAAFLLRTGADGQPVVNPSPNWNTEWLFVEIPLDIRQLKQNDMHSARAWQLAFRHVIQDAFALGYTAVDFITSHDRCWYSLKMMSMSVDKSY